DFEYGYEDIKPIGHDPLYNMEMTRPTCTQLISWQTLSNTLLPRGLGSCCHLAYKHMVGEACTHYVYSLIRTCIALTQHPNLHMHTNPLPMLYKSRLICLKGHQFTEKESRKCVLLSFSNNFQLN
ncbi:hypothetical protein ACJX0J_007406, partial [Zea mays]